MAVQAVGSVVSGISQNAQAKSEAKAADTNAEIVQDQAAAQASSIRERARRAQGSNIANAGASGVGLDGSFADALSDNAINSELDAQTALWNGALESRSLRSQAAQSRSSGTAALFSGFLGAASKGAQAYGAWGLTNTQNAGAASNDDDPWTPAASRNGF